MNEIERLEGVLKHFGTIYNRFNDTDEGVATRKTLCLPFAAAGFTVGQVRALGWQLGSNGKLYEKCKQHFAAHGLEPVAPGEAPLRTGRPSKSKAHIHTVVPRALTCMEAGR